MTSALLADDASLLTEAGVSREEVQAYRLLTTVGTPASAASATKMPAEVAALMPLLAAGMNDKAIAHHLGISVRTLMRRIAKLLSILDARSRFQAGWFAALRMHAVASSSELRADASELELQRASAATFAGHRSTAEKLIQPSVSRNKTR